MTKRLVSLHLSNERNSVGQSWAAQFMDQMLEWQHFSVSTLVSKHISSLTQRTSKVIFLNGRKNPGYNCPAWHTACFFFFFFLHTRNYFSLRLLTLGTTVTHFIQLHISSLNQRIIFADSWFGRVANLSCTPLRNWTTPPLSHARGPEVQLLRGNYTDPPPLTCHQILITFGEINTKLIPYQADRASSSSSSSMHLTLPTPLVPLYRGAVKAPWAALVAAVVAAWRTAWLAMTPVANSAWAFWKLASVCLYRLWIWRRGRAEHADTWYTQQFIIISCTLWGVKMIRTTWSRAIIQTVCYLHTASWQVHHLGAVDCQQVRMQLNNLDSAVFGRCDRVHHVTISPYSFFALWKAFTSTAHNKY